ncbi:MAG: hypothetical protein U9R25_05720 [Chloroflexota bacterium]|nr:hypothetical protein [Chloroflexota bacterium]
MVDREFSLTPLGDYTTGTSIQPDLAVSESTEGTGEHGQALRAITLATGLAPFLAHVVQ